MVFQLLHLDSDVYYPCQIVCADERRVEILAGEWMDTRSHVENIAFVPQRMLLRPCFCAVCVGCGGARPNRVLGLWRCSDSAVSCAKACFCAKTQPHSALGLGQRLGAAALFLISILRPHLD